jgi:hypothetical protein
VRLDELLPAIANATSAVNACDGTTVEHLNEIEPYVEEIAIHGVRAGAAGALATAQLRHGVQLVDSLTPTFIEECMDEGFDELVEEFADRVNVVADVTPAEDIVNKVFEN